MTHVRLIIFVLVLFAAAPAQVPAPQPARPEPRVEFENFLRTELYFGRSKAGGGLVTDDEWKAFLAETVSPLFPAGFTQLSGRGQYRDKSGKVVSEPSEVLIFFYPSRSKKESRARIEQIRTAYVKRFDQESVLRVDLPKAVRVSF